MDVVTGRDTEKGILGTVYCLFQSDREEEFCAPP